MEPAWNRDSSFTGLKRRSFDFIGINRKTGDFWVSPWVTTPRNRPGATGTKLNLRTRRTLEELATAPAGYIRQFAVTVAGAARPLHLCNHPRRQTLYLARSRARCAISGTRGSTTK
jgi:hypothetical protein